MVLPTTAFMNIILTLCIGAISGEQSSLDVALGKQSVIWTKYVWSLQYFHFFTIIFIFMQNNLFVHLSLITYKDGI